MRCGRAWNWKNDGGPRFLSDLQLAGKRFGLSIGRCSQRLAGEEAYLRFLEALESLLRNDVGAARRLRASAPSWYAQLIPLSESDPSDARLQEYLRTTTQERVKRELAAFFYEVTREQPLILFFDDMHWADPSTVDLLAHLATKFDSTRIMVVVTYRPSELFLLKDPFIQVMRDLRSRWLCRDIGVEFLSPEDVSHYIALEFSGNSFPQEFAGLIHSRTEGNPLFMVDLLRYLRDRGVILKSEADASWRLVQSLPDLSRDCPQSVSNVIDRKIEQLSDRDREVLASASVQGYEFDSTAVARALEASSIEIEEALERLDRIHEFVKHIGDSEHSSGAPTVRYRFVHVLYQNALYASLTPARRVAISAALARAL
jgi:predicted ATPase